MSNEDFDLKQYFDVAVAEVTPDVTALVHGGEEHGLRLRRRHRTQAALGVAAAAVVTVGAVALGQEVFEHHATGPTDTHQTTSVQLVGASPRGLAAGLLQHLDPSHVVAVVGNQQREDGKEQLTAEVAYTVGDEKYDVQVVALENVAQWSSETTCPDDQLNFEQVLLCNEDPLPDGTPAFQLLAQAGRSDGGSELNSNTYLMSSGVKREDQIVAVVVTVLVPKGQSVAPDSLALGLDDLTPIVTDPAVGLSTTAALNAAGEKIADFKDTLVTTDSGSGSGSASATGHVEPAQPAPSEGSSASPR